MEKGDPVVFLHYFEKITSNLDGSRHGVFVAENSEKALGALQISTFFGKPCCITASKEEERIEGEIEKIGDVVEIIVGEPVSINGIIMPCAENTLEITIGEFEFTLPPGRWMIPILHLRYRDQDVRTKGACKIQYFYFDTDTRRMFVQALNSAFQMLGGTTPVLYEYGRVKPLCSELLTKKESEELLRTCMDDYEGKIDTFVHKLFDGEDVTRCYKNEIMPKSYYAYKELAKVGLLEPFE